MGMAGGNGGSGSGGEWGLFELYGTWKGGGGSGERAEFTFYKKSLVTADGGERRGPRGAEGEGSPDLIHLGQWSNGLCSDADGGLWGVWEIARGRGQASMTGVELQRGGLFRCWRCA